MESLQCDEKPCPQDLEQHIKSLTEYFYTDRTDLYFKEVPEIEKKIKNGEINFSSKTELKNPEELLKYYKEQPVIHQIYDDISLYEKCSFLENFINTSQPDSDYSGIKTWFKYEENIQSITTCGGSVIECDLFYLFAVLSEIDLMKQFIDQYEDIIKVAEVSPFRWLMHCKLKMPITFSNRDLVCTGFGVINQEEKNILLTFKSVDNFLNVNIPPESSDYKRIFLHFGYYKIQFLSENKYYLTCAFNYDPKIPVVPWFILNKFLKWVTYYIIDGLKKQLKDPRAKVIYQKRIEEKKEYYEMLKKALNLLY